MKKIDISDLSTMSGLLLPSTLSTLDTINIILHLTGCYLLNNIYHNGNRTVQQLYLINLSIIEATKNVGYLIWNVSVIIYLSKYSISSMRIASDVKYYLIPVIITGVYLSYFLAMTYLTVDRLLHVLLHMKYSMFWTINKARKLLIVTCMVNFTISVTFALTFYFTRSDRSYGLIVKKMFYIYIPTVLYTIFLILAVVSYIIMFLKFANSRRVTTERDPEDPRQSLGRIFLNSRFFISIMLVLSYLILMIIPSLIRTFYFITGTRVPKLVNVYIDISITLSDTADGIIFIFMNPSVRTLLLKKLSSLFNRNTSNVVCAFTAMIRVDTATVYNINDNVQRTFNNEAIATQ